TVRGPDAICTVRLKPLAGRLGAATGVTGARVMGAVAAPAPSTTGRSASLGYCLASPRADTDRTMHAPGSTWSTAAPVAPLACDERHSGAPALDSTRRPLVDPLSVTHHASLSSQNSQCRRLA